MLHIYDDGQCCSEYAFQLEILSRLFIFKGDVNERL